MNDSEKIPKRVAIYMRVSTDDQIERFGIHLQRASIDSLILSKQNTEQPYLFAGDEYVYIDDGVSGTVELEQRPAFSRLIEDITLSPEGAKPFDAVAVYKIDRFARKLKVLLNAIDFFGDHDLQFLSVTESIDTSTPFGRAMLSIIGVIAELERDTIKDRTSAGRVQAVKSGVHMGTGAPYGYAKDENKRLIALEEEAKVVQSIFDLYVVQKMSVYQIADFLTDRKYLTPEASGIQYKKHKGKAKAKNLHYKWHAENIRRLITNELYTGKAYYGKTKDGKKVPKDQWLVYPVPQLVDELTFEKAQRIARQSKHGSKEKRNTHKYLLSGLLRCDCCREGVNLKHYVGLPQTVPSTGKKVYYYVCKGKSHEYKNNRCPTLPMGADAIEDYIVNLCSDLLSNPIHTYKYQQSLESTKLRTKQLKRDEDRLLKLVDGMPERKERLRLQHELNMMDESRLRSELVALVESEKADREKLKEIQMQLSQCTIDQAYISTFELFDKKYREVLSKLGKNRDEVYKLLHLMIDEIVVYSRPVRESDRIAGRKKKGQMVANRIHVKFRLPQDMLNEIGTQKELITEKAPESGTSSSQKDIFGGR